MLSQNSGTVFSADHFELLKVFHPYSVGRVQWATTNNLRFAHYTSADTASKIIQGQKVWMRKASCMNDYMELEHGFDCLRATFNRHKDEFASTFDELFPSFTDSVVKRFDEWLPTFRDDTYITSLSEHDSDEDHLGRLSMWRAYGGTTGVALVMNGGPFLRPSDALRAYTYPVAYFSATRFDQEFLRILQNVRKESDLVRRAGQHVVHESVFETFRTAMLCTKHPGFHEEREWRIIYTPSYLKSGRIGTEIHTVAGTPQPICTIPLTDVPSEGLYGVEIPELLDRLIIGPTRYPTVIRQAMIALLEQAGVQDASKRIFVSDIPLRT